MKYASMFSTIAAIWVATIIMASLVSDTETRYVLFRLILGYTLLLFIIGFARNS